MASTDTPDSLRLPSDNAGPPSLDAFRNEQSGISADPKADWQRRRSEKQLIREAGKVGDIIPASFDPNRTPAGRFVKGHMVRGGTRKRLSHRQIWENALATGGTPLMRKLAAHALGLREDSEDIPDDLATAHDFHVWVMTHRALFSLDAFREIYDRLDPKPQRLQVDATVNAKRTPISGSVNADEAAEAEAYFAELNEPDVIDVEYDEEPVEAKPDPLAFLE